MYNNIFSKIKSILREYKYFLFVGFIVVGGATDYGASIDNYIEILQDGAWLYTTYGYLKKSPKADKRCSESACDP